MTTSEGMPASSKVAIGLSSPGMRKILAIVSSIVSVIVFFENMKWYRGSLTAETILFLRERRCGLSLRPSSRPMRSSIIARRSAMR